MKILIRSAALFLAAICLHAQVYAQTKPDRFKEQLEPVIKQVMEQANMPGFAIAIVENQKIVYSAGFGVKSLQTREPISAQSLFHMASITKPFVATSIMQLWEKGKIDLDAPVVKYLPYFRIKDERSATITIRQMLSHISGMPDVEDYEWDKPQYDEGALERYVKSLGNEKLIAAPGTKFQYSNMAFEVLGDVIAKVSGESFEDYVKHNILDPLKMQTSTLLVKKADPQLLARPHVLGSSYDVEVSKIFPYNRMHSPSSTLYSNVLDMSRWAMANLNRGELDGKRVLKASTYDLMWKPAGEQFQQVGISWFLRKFKDYPTVTHSGGDTGFVSNLVLIPEKSIAVVMMSNFDRAPLGVLTQAALDVALGLQPAPVSIKTPIDRVLYKAIAKEGLEAGVKQYYDLKKSQPDAYNFQEQLLNTLGYVFIQQGKMKEAIRVLQLNVEAYPASSNVYDSLGEAYMRNGDKALAIENYEKSLKLDAGNSNAVEMLKKLKEQ
jgi:CubicO group peptidase (beta-lactamase class C family)